MYMYVKESYGARVSHLIMSRGSPSWWNQTSGRMDCTRFTSSKLVPKHDLQTQHSDTLVFNKDKFNTCDKCLGVFYIFVMNADFIDKCLLLSLSWNIWYLSTWDCIWVCLCFLVSVCLYRSNCLIACLSVCVSYTRWCRYTCTRCICVSSYTAYV